MAKCCNETQKRKFCLGYILHILFDHIARNLEPVECKLIFSLDGIEPN